jgi:cytochrome c-type biogenesis protein CcsB
MSTEQLARASNDAFNAALFSYLAAMVGYFHFLVFRRRVIWRLSSVVAYAGLAAHVVSVVSRGMAAHRVPWGNMYEYSSLVALLVVAGYLIVVEGWFKARSLGGFALGFSVLTMAVAVTALYVGPGPLVPALNSYWIKVHVVAAIVGSSLFALGGLLTMLYLVADRRERRSAVSVRPPIMGGSLELDAPPGLVPDAEDAIADEADDSGRAAAQSQGSALGRRLLPPAAALDRMAYRIIAFGFPVWTFAVIAGAIWAENAWGRYWGWDPKETWSFITWVIFAGYLHARATAGWQGRKAAVIALVGFVSLLITYYAVNLFIVGLHSYAGV